MATKLVGLTDTPTVTLPGVSISGDNPAALFGLKAGDIVHTRAGQTISARSWASRRRWDIFVPVATVSEIYLLQFLWAERVFYLQPAGSSALQYKVRWVGDFRPKHISGSKLSIEIPLEQTL